ncbi:MAG: acetoacetate--CoA ligase [Rhodospirillaceae bacterium]|nr:acetoacetate--CoA ligase [Rhodospirillaceae bacterium]
MAKIGQLGVPTVTEPLWRPSAERIENANLTRFKKQLEEAHGVSLADYQALQRYSVEQKESFWAELWDFAEIVSETRGDRVLVDGDQMPGAQFFPDAKLNFAENLLRRRDDSDALVFWAEDQIKRRMSWRELYDAVSQLASALKGAGIKPGDRCAGFVPNAPEAIIAMLAATSLGAVWTSCSPDFGTQGVLDRFGQVQPKVLFTADGYIYDGKRHSSIGRVKEILADLPGVERVIVFPFLEQAPDIGEIDNAVLWPNFVAAHRPGYISFERLPFNHPLYIMYSSGTTGAPKCIVHSAGGALLQHLKEHKLHCDVKPGDRIFYFTTCGWMMWNWLVGGLASEATLLLYDGSPFAAKDDILFDLAEAEGMSLFGTSAKYIDTLSNRAVKPAETHDLSTLRTLASTGSPLVPEGFDYVYENIKQDICLSSISGGTDILGCFVCGDPTGPVRRGEIQALALGMATDVFDGDGNSVQGEKGELVCTEAFPSMPIGFWNDDDGSRYRAAYFERFPNIWCHGDFVELTEHGGMVIYGRSDATLNPGGVRIGTAEIYRQVEAFPNIEEAICIGQEWDNDTRVILFVRMAAGAELDEALIAEVRQRIRENCSPRHMPAKVIVVADIPRTRSGKITELAVRDVIHGREVKNKEALANPEALAYFADLAELGSA